MSESEAPDVFVESGSIAWSEGPPRPEAAHARFPTVLALALLVIVQFLVIGWQWQLGSVAATATVALPAVRASVPAPSGAAAISTLPAAAAAAPPAAAPAAVPASRPLALPLASRPAANDAAAFRAADPAPTTPGQVTAISQAVPDGLLHINAAPWADVSIDGRALGTTPLANIRLPIGSHDVIFRHPLLGERTVRVVVTADGAARVSVDLRQP